MTLSPYAQKLIASGDLRLNLGSGVDYRPGYLNVDLDAGAKPDVVMDFLQIEKAIPAGSVVEIMMIHSLNYLPLWEARGVFLMARRLLKPGGKLIIETVDLHRAIEKILSNGGNFNEYIEGVRALHAFGIDQLERREAYSPYAFSWSKWHLESELRHAGWQDIRLLPPETHAPWRDMRFECTQLTAFRSLQNPDFLPLLR